MKKLLALVMALVMSLSLVTISSNAAFGDQEKIKHDEAVQIMASLGILAGKEDGNFDPEGTLTRAEAAKIISYMLIGTESACKLTPNGTQFTDVAADHWAAPYIAYCDAQGIINGNGDGTFDPEGKLTGYAFAKMLLVAIGFDGDYTGAAWQANVAADLEKTKKQDATENDGLKEELKDIILANEISRDEAAQMAFNALFFRDKDTSTYKIRLTNPSGNNYGNVTSKEFDSYQEAYTYMLSCGVDYEANEDNEVYTIVSTGNDTLAEDNFNVTAVGGVVESNQATSLQEYTVVSGQKINYETGADMIGHYVVAYLDTTMGDDGLWNYDEGDKEEEKGLCFTMVDKTTVVEVAEDTYGLTKNAVKSLLGVTVSNDNFNPTAYLSNYSNGKEAELGIQPIAEKEGYDGKYNVAAGKYLTVEDIDDKVYVYGYADDASWLVNFHVELDDAENKYYTVYTEDKEVVKVAEDEDDCFNTINQNIDWLSYIGKGYDNEDSEDFGDVVFATTLHGKFGITNSDDVQMWRLDLAEVETVTGNVTKVVTKNVGEEDEIKQIYVDGTAYDYNDDPSAISWIDEVAKNIYTAKLDDNNFITNKLPDTAKDKTQVFFLLNGKIVAFVNEDNSTDAQMFVPVKFCVVDTLNGDDSTDSYGESDLDAYDRYEFFLQGVDANGAEVKIYLDVADLIDDNNEVIDGALIENFLNQFFAAADANAVISAGEAKEGEDDFYAVANAMVKELKTKDVADGVFENIWFYSDEDDYTKFTTKVDKPNEEATTSKVKDASTGNVVTKDTKRVTDGDDTYLLGAGYTVIKFSGEGSKLKITTSENVYGALKKDAALLYGTKTSTASSYTLKYVFLKDAGSIDMDELIFVPEKFTKANSAKLEYKDSNGRAKTITVYEETIYDGADMKTINVESSHATHGVGFYEYEIDEDKGTYTLTPAGDATTLCIYGFDSENGAITLNTLGKGTKYFDKDLPELIVNTTDFDVKTGSFASDSKHAYFADAKFDGDDIEEDAIESLYIYAVAPKITLQYTKDGKWTDAEVTFTDFNESGNAQFNYAVPYGTTSLRVVRTSAQGLSRTVTNNMIDVTVDATVLTVSEANCIKAVISIVDSDPS